MIIDSHNHPEWHGYNLEKFLRNMEQYRIDKTWLLSWECPQREYDPNYYKMTPEFGEYGPIPFTRCVAFAERRPEKFVLGYAPDPRRPEAIDVLQAAIDLYGVRIYGELKLRMMYDDLDAIRMFRFCGRKNLPVVVHIDYEFSTGTNYPRPNWWYGGGIDSFERAVKACPETIFIGHSPGFWAHLSNDDQYDKVAYPSGNIVPGGKVMQMLDLYPNLYCDISAGSGLNALTRDPAFAKPFLVEYQDRLLYGRDCFDNNHQMFLDQLGLDEAVLQKIYAQNALKLVPL